MAQLWIEQAGLAFQIAQDVLPDRARGPLALDQQCRLLAYGDDIDLVAGPPPTAYTHGEER
ncbi:MAG TPA: hypothetical protein VM366_02035 [Anaerolineae bacterium]|nr:hypothetical protein [Anaerolineae bacterium]